jgi:hypothetical protein
MTDEIPIKISFLTKTWRKLKKTTLECYGFTNEYLFPHFKHYVVFILSGKFHLIIMKVLCYYSLLLCNNKEEKKY